MMSPRLFEDVNTALWQISATFSFDIRTDSACAICVKDLTS